MNSKPSKRLNADVTRPVPLRILVVAPHASYAWGGEAVLPLHLFRGLEAAGHEAWLLAGDETKSELLAVLGPAAARVVFVGATAAHHVLKNCERRAPRWLPKYFFFFAASLLTQRRQAAIARTLIAEKKIDLVHQPAPVSPKLPSFLVSLGAPVVLGPYNGGMEYPPGFQFLQTRLARFAKTAGRLSARFFHAAFPGQRDAAAVLIANERTRGALATTPRGVVNLCVENGIDPALWGGKNAPSTAALRTDNIGLNVIFVGRLERWKGAEWLVAALAEPGAERVKLTVVGDFGSERARLADLATSLKISDRVRLVGFRPQTEVAGLVQAADALVLPSVFECGGAVVLEAMAASKPVIAVAWGGPADYLTPQTGILVPASDPITLPKDLARALASLENLGAEGRAAMGERARERAFAEFAWPVKIAYFVALYRELLGQ